MGQLRKELDEHRKLSLAFFRGDVLDKFYIVFSSLRLEVELMRDLLAPNSINWEVQEMGKVSSGGRRSFPIANLHHASTHETGELRQFLRRCLARLDSADRWMNVPHSEYVGTYIFKCFARCASVPWQLLVTKCLQFPARLFVPLMEPWRSEEVFEAAIAKPRLLDAFSAGFISKYNSPALLASDEAMMALTAVASNLKTTTFDTERTHTKNITKTRYRITHAVSLGDLAAWSAAFAAPSWMDRHRGNI